MFSSVFSSLGSIGRTFGIIESSSSLALSRFSKETNPISSAGSFSGRVSTTSLREDTISSSGFEGTSTDKGVSTVGITSPSSVSSTTSISESPAE